MTHFLIWGLETPIRASSRLAAIHSWKRVKMNEILPYIGSRGGRIA